MRSHSTYREKQENGGAARGLFGALGAHSRALPSQPCTTFRQFRWAPGRGRDGTRLRALRPPPLFAGAAAAGTKRAAELGEESSALPGARGGGAPPPLGGQQTVRGRQREPHGKRRRPLARPGPRPPRRQPLPGARSPFPRRLLPPALTFRDGLRWALPALAGRAFPPAGRCDAGGEAEPPFPAGRGSAAPPPRGCRRGPAGFKGAGGSGPRPPRAGCGLPAALEECPPAAAVPAADQVRRRLLSHGAAAWPPLGAPRAGPRAAAGREASGSGRGPRPALPLMHRRAPAGRRGGRQGPGWAARRGGRAAGLGAAAAPLCGMWGERRGGGAGPGRGRRAR